MTLTTLKKIIKALNRNKVRYLVVGGIAVVAHGYGRLTHNIDLVIQLKQENIVNAFAAIARLGYRPRIPITAEQFANEKLRNSWIREKGMTVLCFFSDEYRDTQIDVFVKEPFDFDGRYDTAIQESLDKTALFKFVDIQTLIEMKKVAGRLKDQDDIVHLKMIQKGIKGV
jgi:hypothetical protein